MQMISRPSPILRVAAVAVIALVSGGCAGLKSRYAMDNPTYAEKYEVGAEKTDIVGKLKQAVDARWVEGEHGRSLGGGVMTNPDADSWLGTLSYGNEDYVWSHLSSRVGLETLATTEADWLYAGLDCGVRLQPPTRIAPFAGVGASAGVSIGDIAWTILTDEEEGVFSTDEETDWSGIAAVYPEVGAHFWLNGSLRLTLSGRYMITSLGRRHDGWWIGGQIASF